ncbi:MAG: chemotaxis response regulator protein-glutamate methylesterase [Bryobacteraceae bacterium]
MRKTSRIRVLVVDDSSVMRRLVAHALEGDPGIQLAGVAADGLIALEMLSQVNPDLVTLDIEMPRMNGLETLREIRKRYPRLPVIMCSSLTVRGGTSTFEALTLGANDYITKPSTPRQGPVVSAGSSAESQVQILNQSLVAFREELVPKIRQFFPSLSNSRSGSSSAAHNAHPRQRIATGPPAAIVIGVSTGGPTALANIITDLPSTLRVPVLIVQHMPKVFTRLLAERLQTLTKLKVSEATDGDVVCAGRIYVAPGDYHLRLKRRGTEIVTTLDQESPENSCRPAVDVLFRSAADIWGGSVVAVILTGMGQDGLRGVEELKSRGAYVIAQDQNSSVVWGMPGAVVTAGMANAVLDLKQVIPEVLRRL